jgi:hypothetical protein
MWMIPELFLLVLPYGTQIRRRDLHQNLHANCLDFTRDVVPRRLYDRKPSRKQVIHASVIFFPFENLAMTAIADGHVAMQLNSRSSADGLDDVFQ